MAESTEDKDVDALIAEMQTTLNKLKAAQGKDVADEDSEESTEPEPKNLRQAEDKARRVMRSDRKQADEESSEKKPDDEASEQSKK